MSKLFLPEFKLSLGILFVIAVTIVTGCQKPVETPARTLVGSYSSDTHSPIYFADQSDSCHLIYSIYDSTGISINWNISYLQENLVTIIATATHIDSTIHLPIDTLGNVCPLGFQFKFPDTLRGIVGGTGPSTLIVERSYIYYDTLSIAHIAYSQLGSFALTKGTATGTLSDLQCDTLPAHCYGYRTLPFTLYKD